MFAPVNGRGCVKAIDRKPNDCQGQAAVRIVALHNKISRLVGWVDTLGNGPKIDESCGTGIVAMASSCQTVLVADGDPDAAGPGCCVSSCGQLSRSLAETATGLAAIAEARW